MIIAVVGTDTGVGKTSAARSLLSYFKRTAAATMIKPFVTGTRTAIGPARYRKALSPYGAIRLGEPRVPMKRVKNYIAKENAAHEITIIEGIGGVMVPLEAGTLWCDFHQECGWPCVVIARGGLGTISHTLLTIEALTKRNIPILGFVLNGGARRAALENASIIAEFTKIESLGIVAYDSKRVSRAWNAGADWSLLEARHGRN